MTLLTTLALITLAVLDRMDARNLANLRAQQDREAAYWRSTALRLAEEAAR